LAPGPRPPTAHCPTPSPATTRSARSCPCASATPPTPLQPSKSSNAPPEQVVWRCVDGPQDRIDTRITYALNPRDDGGTTLLFSHEGWQQENELMNGCSTNWAAYLMSLKSGAEGHGFNAYPGGEIIRWD
jgi:hypothetical protein